MESGLASKRLTSRDFCSHFQWMNRPQIRKCRENPKAVMIVGQGTYNGLQECQLQFKDYRWNCTGQRNSWRLFEKMNKKRTKETSFLSAIASASAALALAKACSLGSLKKCGCGQRNYLYEEATISEKDLFPWKGCQSHIIYGLTYSRYFLDPMSERRRQRSLRKLIGKQNNAAGREIYKSKLKPVCRCHGATGSCVTKACWQPLPNLYDIGSRLRDKYKTAVEVRLNRRKVKLRSKRNKKYRIQPDDLVYSDSSPDFCEPNKDYGTPGTHGRLCNKTGDGLDRCSILCCGRGYDTFVLRKTFRCHCKFKWCCSVQCEDCTEERIEYRCK
eukprot:gene6261-11674_t